MPTTANQGNPTPSYCPLGSSPFVEACGRSDCGVPAPRLPDDESIADLVRLLARSRPSHRRIDPCLWAK